MLGNLTAPRVGLEDGCSFRGSVEMESVPDKGRQAARNAVVAPVKPPSTPSSSTSSSTSTPPPASPGDGGGPAKTETPPTRP
jgi:hypothetical protein